MTVSLLLLNWVLQWSPGPANVVVQWQVMLWSRLFHWMQRPPRRGQCSLNLGLQPTGQVLRRALMLPVGHLRAFLSLPVSPWPQNFAGFLCFHSVSFCMWVLEMLVSHRSINPLMVCNCIDFLLLSSPQGWLLQPLATLGHETGQCFLKISLQNWSFFSYIDKSICSPFFTSGSYKCITLKCVTVLTLFLAEVQ